MAVAGDTLRHALRRRSWLLLVLAVCAVLAAVVAVVGQSTLPYLMYPAL